MPKHARLDSGQSTLAIPYAVLFRLKACSPPDESSMRSGIIIWKTKESPMAPARLRTVWLDTLRPVAKSNCLCNCVAFSVLFRRAVNCIYRPSVDVVARGRHAPGRRLTFPVSWNRFTALQQHFWRLQQRPRHCVVFARISITYNTPCHGFR
ncbi:hypothetical protein TNCV_1053461 [Trichonephila clavipes]|nr:hypothetical protein TNCV_1053461 [Trichonephila clavipes]